MGLKAFHLHITAATVISDHGIFPVDYSVGAFSYREIPDVNPVGIQHKLFHYQTNVCVKTWDNLETAYSSQKFLIGWCSQSKRFARDVEYENSMCVSADCVCVCVYQGIWQTNNPSGKLTVLRTNVITSE